MRAPSSDDALNRLGSSASRHTLSALDELNAGCERILPQVDARPAAAATPPARGSPYALASGTRSNVGSSVIGFGLSQVTAGADGDGAKVAADPLVATISVDQEAEAGGWLSTTSSFDSPQLPSPPPFAAHGGSYEREDMVYGFSASHGVPPSEAVIWLNARDKEIEAAEVFSKVHGRNLLLRYALIFVTVR